MVLIARTETSTLPKYRSALMAWLVPWERSRLSFTSVRTPGKKHKQSIRVKYSESSPDYLMIRLSVYSLLLLFWFLSLSLSLSPFCGRVGPAYFVHYIKIACLDTSHVFNQYAIKANAIKKTKQNKKQQGQQQSPASSSAIDKMKTNDKASQYEKE